MHIKCSMKFPNNVSVCLGSNLTWIEFCVLYAGLFLSRKSCLSPLSRTRSVFVHVEIYCSKFQFNSIAENHLDKIRSNLISLVESK